MPQNDPPDFDRLWDYQDAAGTEARFREILPQASEAGDPDYLAQLLTQIARTEGLQGRFDDALETIERAQALVTPEMGQARIRCLLERGRILNSSDRPQEAKPYFSQAWSEACRLGEDFYAIDAAHMMAIVERGEPGIEWNLRALELARATSDERAAGWQGSLHNNLGWSYHDLGHYEEALQQFQLGLVWQRSHNKERQARIAAWTVARAMRSLGRTEEALRLQRENLKTVEGAGQPDGYTHEEIGECLLALGRRSEAKPHFARAYEVLSRDEWFANHEEPRLRRMRELSRAEA